MRAKNKPPVELVVANLDEAEYGKDYVSPDDSQAEETLEDNQNLGKD